MHAQNRLEWNQESTEYSFSIFVIWQTIYKNKKFIQKNHIIMNIQDFNQIIISDTYSLLLQSDITAAITECRYINVMNSKKFFYQ